MQYFFIFQILDYALTRTPQAPSLWKEKLLLSKGNEDEILITLKKAAKALNHDDTVSIWNTALDVIEEKETVNIFNMAQCQLVILGIDNPLLSLHVY